MFIAKNQDLIVMVKETREELIEALKFMVYTSIEETEEVYTLVDGKYLDSAEAKIKELELETETLKEQLSALDAKTIRPLRAILSGEGTDTDRAKLVDIEDEAHNIRVQIAKNESIISGGM